MSSEQTFGGPSGANNSTIEYAETAKINGVVGKKVFNIDSTGNILDGNNAVKVTIVGSITYVGMASPGTLQASALWQCKKVDGTSGTVVTWADGNANFDNIATDLTSLSYS
jgi:hypothetical protein